MGKIVKTLQSRHKDTLSPWLRDYVAKVADAPLPKIPSLLEEFPITWPFPRGDLYHWIPLLNRFDNLLEGFCETYHLADGPQSRDFTREVLLNKATLVEYHDDHTWTEAELEAFGYGSEGDGQLVVSILKFSSKLLEHCGNRSIYSSSKYLNDLLHSTSLPVLRAALEVGLELAQRYQASVKRIHHSSRSASQYLLNSHYNIDLDRVLQLSQPFVKTPIFSFTADPLQPATPAASSAKGKEKAHGAAAKNVASMYANDLVALATPDSQEDARWSGWGDVKVVYYPKQSSHAPAPIQHTDTERVHSTVPTTPTPLRRSSTMGPQHRSPRSDRGSSDDSASASQPAGMGSGPGSGPGAEDHPRSPQKTCQIPQSVVLSTPIYELLTRCPEDMPESSRYELLNRVRVAKALLGSAAARQDALTVRLLAIANLSYIHPESAFLEKVMKQDNDEPRRYQLVYQLAELVHPAREGAPPIPLWIQTVAFQLLEAISIFPSKHSDVLSALNANVNHGVLLYVIRKAVAGMRDDSGEGSDAQRMEADEWRNSLLALTSHMSISARLGTEMIGAGIMENFVEILNITTPVAERFHSTALSSLDALIYNFQGAFQAFVDAKGLDRISELTVHIVKKSAAMAEAEQGTPPELRSSIVDYDVPFYQQQTLKWLLKFIHHITTSWYSFGGNTARLLRNLVDNSALLASIRHVIENMASFGSVVWTNAVTILGDFLNNDPTSFAALMESGLIKSFLESLTGRELPAAAESNERHEVDNGASGDDEPSSPESDASAAVLETDERPHPPTQEMLEKPRDGPPARGILVSAEAMAAIPSVLNSVCLNNAGIKMVVSSHALESYLEIFESAPHVALLEAEPELATNIGSSFDELARHHPPLRFAIANAVLDMAARVVHMGKQKAAKAGWGVTLSIPGPVGNSSMAGSAPPVSSGPAHLREQDTEMSSDSAIDEDKDVAGPADEPPEKGMTPHVTAVAGFFSAYIGNSNLKNLLVEKGGIELLLDMSELPSLPYDFAESHASRMLQPVVSQLVEQVPILGLPSLLNRAQTAVDALGPLLAHEGPRAFFAPFVQRDQSSTSGEQDQAAANQAADGTRVVRALMVTVSLVKTLHQCFSTSSRAQTIQFHPVNAYDHYARLAKSLGPLLRVVASEDLALMKLVPRHWHQSPSDLLDQLLETEQQLAPAAPDARAAPAAPDARADSPTPAPEAVGSSSRGVTVDDGAISVIASQAKPLTPQEQKSAAYKNYQTIRALITDLLPTSYRFFQSMGRALLPRRERDPWVRSQHLWLAEVLAEITLDFWKGDDKELDRTDFNFLVFLLDSVDQMLTDSPRQNDRGFHPVIVPVLMAFKEQGGLETLHRLLRHLTKEAFKESPSGKPSDSRSRLLQSGMQKILELYLAIVNGKNITDSVQQVNLAQRVDQRRDAASISSQLVVELRMSILPVVLELWESPIVEKAQHDVLSLIVEILKTIAAGDNESGCYKRADRHAPAISKREPMPFEWSPHRSTVNSLSQTSEDATLVREAVYRANGLEDVAKSYIKAHMHDPPLAGARNPIPEVDAWKEEPRAEPAQDAQPSEPAPPASASDGPNGPGGGDAMVIDSTPELGRLIVEAVSGFAQDADAAMDAASSASNDNDDDTPSRTSDAHEASGSSSASVSASASANPAQAPLAVAQASQPPSVVKEDLDEARKKLRTGLIDRCLDVIRAHPASVFEVSELILQAILRSENEEARVEVGDTLVNALMSFSFDEDVKKSSAGSIAAYAHLLSMLLQESKSFFRSTVKTLKDNVGEYLTFLKLSPDSITEALPPWIPYILLIFEILLVDDEQPVEAKYTIPTAEEENTSLVLQEKEPIVNQKERLQLLDSVLEILPRVGKDDMLAVAILRLLVILTRDRGFAKTISEKKHLVRLFVMVKQLSGLGSARFKSTKIGSYVLSILRHIIEDDDTIRQTMRFEIRGYFENPQRSSSRHYDLSNYLRSLSHVALRSPKLFVETTEEMVKLQKWDRDNAEGQSRSYPLMLKESTSASGLTPTAAPSTQTTAIKDDSVEPAVQATEDLNINEVKPSTETGDKEMTDAPKTPGTENKRPIVENPDGVINFLLEQLLNYQKVDDTEPAQTSSTKDKGKEPAPPVVAASASSLGAPSGAAGGAPTSSPAPSATPDSAAPATEDAKDKKPPKQSFKSEDHPIFIYRCFILHCLSELLHCYNRAKIEFINFKRGAPLLVNTPTPVKPRSSVLNYLLNDLLCFNSLQAPSDTTAAKKKVSTSDQARRVLVALVAKTGEKPVNRHARRFEPSDEPDLVFVRKFVLDTVLRAYREASTSNEPFDVRYAKMLSLAELMYHMIDDKENKDPTGSHPGTDPFRSFAQIKRMMYEKGYIAALTASVADIDLTFPNVKRTIKYILRVLNHLTNAASVLSQENILPPTGDNVEDEIMSASSLSDLDDQREETPDLYRNSALGMLEPREEDDFSEESDDDDEEMYDDGYDDEMGYDEEMSDDGEENVSDEDEELGGMGHIEGLSGEPGVVEVIMGEDDDDESMDDDDEDDEDGGSSGSSDEDEEDEEADSDDVEEIEDRIEIDAEGNAVEDDGASDWESESENDDEDEEELDFEGAAHDLDEARLHGVESGQLSNIMRAAIEAEGFEASDFIDEFQPIDRFLEDEEGDDDEEEGEDEMDEDVFIYDRDNNYDPPPNMPAGLGWDSLVVEQAGGGHRSRHGGIRSPFPVAPVMISHGSSGNSLNEFRNFFRPRAGAPSGSTGADDGLNPLLRRHRGGPARDSSPRPAPANMIRFPLLDGNSPMAILNDIVASIPQSLVRGGPSHHLSLQFHYHSADGQVRVLPPLPQADTRRDIYSEPSHAVAFTPVSTVERWHDEARMIFGMTHHEKSYKLVSVILSKILPPAIAEDKEVKRKEAERKREAEEARKKRDEEERKQKEAEAKAAREKEEAEKRAEEERKAAEAAAAAAAAAESEPRAADAANEGQQTTDEPQAMEGVESTQAPSLEANAHAPSAPAPASDATAESQERVMTTIRGEEVDITGLGIDPEYLAALPEEFREEVIAQTLTARRSEARQQAENTGTGESSEAFNEFLDALPVELREEIIQQEAQERRRRDREEERRRNNANAPQDMDTASILLTFDPVLRNEILLDQHEELADHLTPDLLAQARALAERQPRPSGNAMSRTRDAARQVADASAALETKPQRRPCVQMLDKAGVATLLRLMFISQQASIRSHLFGVLSDVCENRQNRLEVISTLLQILQDGSTDMDAVERSFGQLSLKARQPRDKDQHQKTPGSIKRASTTMTAANTTIQGNSEISPLLIVQQCLDLLVELCRNPHTPSLFLTEHDIVGSSLRRTLSRKGKNKDVKHNKYAINSLLSLLGRDLVMESSSVMQLLADLLNKVTFPLQALERRRREAEEEEKKASAPSTDPVVAGASKTPTTTSEQPTSATGGSGADAGAAGAVSTTGSQQDAGAPVAAPATSSIAAANDNVSTNATAPPPATASASTAAASASAPAEAEAENSKAQESHPSASETKKSRQLQPPVIPVANLTLVINIFVARECSSKTFQNTISTIKNLSNIPGAKAVFGQELVRQARVLSENIVADLGDLLPHILKAESGTEIQGVALAKFSPGASEQNKLLRVLTALDHLFETKPKKAGDEDSAAAAKESEKQEFISSLYHNSTFGQMWENLGRCLRAIHQRENMVNVATILLPLIESLMVVCKNTTLSDGSASQPQSQVVAKELLLSSPPPEDRMAGLFFTFTEEHRRVLNELVRNNPKLMSGTFSLLVKNPKVLEFDNKRNYFNRSVHSKTGGARPSFPPLQLSVRRDHVFHDSFKSLYFKKGDEMKYGKLNIRFHGEEGVDAGGVTREWFQVLARQMFDPNYVLFTPVSSDRTTFHPNKLSNINDEHLMFFKFIGRIIGKALYEGRVLDCYFSRAVYKRILGKPVSVKDMESFDPEYYKSLVWMLENDIADIITETFAVEDEAFGATKVVDLCENGRNIPVTDENKHDYVRLIVEHKLLASVKDQMAEFLQGFHDIIPAELIAIFNEQELELLISGLPDIDVDDWKSHTEYHNYTAASQQIQWFWRAVRSFDKEERAKLLQFVTGTSKVPLNGFKELEGMNGVNRFNIHRDPGNKDRLPSSHTCFNQLDLPEYESYEMLRTQVLKAITAGSDYFGFA